MNSKDQTLLEEAYKLVSEEFYSNADAQSMERLIGELILDQEVYNVDTYEEAGIKGKGNGLVVKYKYGPNEFHVTITQTKALSKKDIEKNRKKGLYTF